MLSSFLDLLNTNEQYIQPGVELGLKSFRLNVLSKLAQRSPELFYSHFTEDTKDTYLGFRAESELRTIARHGKTNLDHISFKNKLPLLSVEEKTDPIKLNFNDTVTQITRYCHSLLLFATLCLIKNPMKIPLLLNTSQFIVY